MVDFVGTACVVRSGTSSGILFWLWCFKQLALQPGVRRSLVGIEMERSACARNVAADNERIWRGGN